MYCTVLHCTLLYCTVLYCTVLYCTVLYCTVRYSTLLYCTPQSVQANYGVITSNSPAFWFNPLNAKLIPICHLLALLGAHHIFHVSRIRVKTQLHQCLAEWLGCQSSSHEFLPGDTYVELQQNQTSPVLILLASCQQTCMTCNIVVCTVKNSWWWTQELSETCRILFQK